jgi:hypothetical protein
VGAGAASTVISVAAEVPFRVAVTRAVVFVCTDAAAALNMPLLDPAATVMKAGTASAAWLLESATVVELVTVALRPTVQLTCPGPVTLPAAQLNCDTLTGVGAGPADETVIAPPVPELGSSGPSILALTTPVTGTEIDPLAVPEA